MFGAIRFEDESLWLIDQRKLPTEEHWIECRSVDETADAIRSMVVRGAPAIGCAAAYGLALGPMRDAKAGVTWQDYMPRWQHYCRLMSESRPTAVNLFDAIEFMNQIVRKFDLSLLVAESVGTLVDAASSYFNSDIQMCKKIGEIGASYISPTRPLRVLTHCNTGSLATAGYGTALGVIRSLHQRGCIERVYVDETRPYLQGSRLTAYELSKDHIPHQIIADSAAAWGMNQLGIDLVVVGADRIAQNGDTANKIGTYSVAVNAKHHRIPFYVAAPFTTVDSVTKSGREIPIEERDSGEIKCFHGTQVAPSDSDVWNPSFDVTPNELITAIFTEKAAYRAPFQFKECQ